MGFILVQGVPVLLTKTSRAAEASCTSLSPEDTESHGLWSYTRITSSLQVVGTQDPSREAAQLSCFRGGINLLVEYCASLTFCLPSNSGLVSSMP